MKLPNLWKIFLLYSTIPFQDYSTITSSLALRVTKIVITTWRYKRLTRFIEIISTV